MHEVCSEGYIRLLVDKTLDMTLVGSDLLTSEKLELQQASGPRPQVLLVSSSLIYG